MIDVQRAARSASVALTIPFRQRHQGITMQTLQLALLYYGIDWIAMGFTFIAIYLLGNRSRKGFVTMMCGNTCWVIVGVLSSSVAMVIANAVFLAMNARGWIKWSATS
jgi:hypothetical protein